MFYFYILKCKDGSLYCGSTNDLKHRELLHNMGKGSKYVRSRGGGKIIYSEKFRTLSKALKREAEVKGWSREMKLKLAVSSTNKRLLRLSRSHGPRNDSKGGYNFAAIFDMDGVLVNNTEYHILTWQRFAKQFGVNVSKKTVREKFIGRLGREIVRDILPVGLSDLEIEKLDAKREAYYRQIYAPVIKPVAGLAKFLEYLKLNKVKMALATAAPTLNVKFVLSETGLKKYFKIIVDAKGVKRGKPNPDVFLKAAKILAMPPSRCVVFEDALNGIEAARRAKMKVVGVATSHRPAEIKHADMIVKDFTRLKLADLRNLF